MNTCAVTIAGPDRRVDLVVSTETPIADLIPTFVELSMDEAPAGNGRAPVWTVTPPGQQPLPLDRTLGQCGVSDGAVLTLTEIRSQAMAPPRPAEVVRRPEVQRGTPRERTAGGAARGADRRGAVLARDEGVLRLRARAADHRVARAGEPDQPRGADQARAAVGDRALARRAGARATTRRGWTARSPRRGSRAAPRSRSSRRRAGWGRPP